MARMHDLTNRHVINKPSASLLAALLTFSWLAGAPPSAVAAESGTTGPGEGSVTNSATRHRASIPLRKRATLALQRLRWNKNRNQRARFQEAFEEAASSDSPLSALFTKKAKKLAVRKPGPREEYGFAYKFMGTLAGIALPGATAAALWMTDISSGATAVGGGAIGAFVGGFVGNFVGFVSGDVAFENEQDRQKGILHGREELRTQIETSGELSSHLLAYLPERDLIALREATLAHVTSLSAKETLTGVDVDTLTRAHKTMTVIDARLKIPSVGSSSLVRIGSNAHIQGDR